MTQIKCVVLGCVSALAVLSGDASAGSIVQLKSVGAIALQDQSETLANAQGFDQGRERFVVQFASAITEADQGFLTAQGIEIDGYLPEDALVVRASAPVAALAKTLSSRVRAVARFAAEWKLSPSLTSREKRLLVSTTGPGAARELSRIPGVRVEAAPDRDAVVLVSPRHPEALGAIAALESVEWIEAAPVIVDFALPVDAAAPSANLLATPPPATGYESGTKLMGFDAAWNRGFRGEGQVAAVGDTGLDSGDASTLHADFRDGFMKGYLSGMGTSTWADSNGHGTHVSGSVMGSGRLSDGLLQGGAHRAKLGIQSIWSSFLDNLAPSTNIESMIGPVYRDGARVHSNSWGAAGNFGAYDAFAARMDEYMWNHPDMLILFAAGNSGQDLNGDGRIDERSVSSPGTAKNVLTVGASKNLITQGGYQKKMVELRDGKKKWGAEPISSSMLSDNPQGLAAFSSRGPTTDGRLKPEIVAPGTNIVSTRSHHPKAGLLWGEYDAEYAYSGGTSMSTPLTAGAATVTREFLIKDRHIAEPSAALIKAVLLHTASDLFPGQFGRGAGQELLTPRPNMDEGYGRVNMDSATALGDETVITDEKVGVSLSGKSDQTVTVGSAGTLRATLVYTDAPAAISASRTLVNDLDLSVVGPDGKTYEKKDRINNAEMLELTGLAAGRYRVIVAGVNVPQGRGGKQPFALVVSSR